MCNALCKILGPRHTGKQDEGALSTGVESHRIKEKEHLLDLRGHVGSSSVLAPNCLRSQGTLTLPPKVPGDTHTSPKVPGDTHTSTYLCSISSSSSGVTSQRVPSDSIAALPVAQERRPYCPLTDLCPVTPLHN